MPRPPQSGNDTRMTADIPHWCVRHGGIWTLPLVAVSVLMSAACGPSPPSLRPVMGAPSKKFRVWAIIDSAAGIASPTRHP